MAKIKSLHFKLPKDFKDKINALLSHFSITLEDADTIAKSILELSNFYIAHPEKNTPWSEEFAQISYLCYFLPLNYLRSCYVIQEYQKILGEITDIIEYGSGLGATSMAIGERNRHLKVHCVELSNTAIEIHKQLVHGQGYTWSHQINLSVKSKTGVFSYVLTEMDKVPEFLFEFENLIILEPSTKQDGRKLQSLRKQLLNAGFFIHAPCVHQLNCPLLEHSKTDWCHQKIYFEQETWFQKIENLLPIKNRELSFSYLIASKKEARKRSEQARVVGEPLVTKGKQRQLVCRGEDREFISWLSKRNTPQEFHRGDILKLPVTMEKRGEEIRPGAEKVLLI